MDKPVFQRKTDEPTSFFSDLGLLFEAVTDAFRSLSPASEIESRWSRLSRCGRSFGSRC